LVTVPASIISGVDAEVAAPDADELLAHGRGHGAASHAERGPVLHQAHAVVGDPASDGIDRRRRDLHDREIAQHERVDLLHVNPGVAEGGGHPGRHLGHDEAGVPERRERDADRQAEVAETALVRGPHEHHGDVQGHAPRAEQGRDLAREDRRVVGAALGERAPQLLSHQESVVPEPVPAALRVRADHAEGHALDDLDVADRPLEADERVEELPVLPADGLDEHPVPRPDRAERTLGRGRPVRIELSPVRGCHPPPASRLPLYATQRKTR
jgi:hypothetical protein